MTEQRTAPAHTHPARGTRRARSAVGAPGTAPRGRLIRPLARPLIVAGDHHAGPPRRPRSLSAAAPARPTRSPGGRGASLRPARTATGLATAATDSPAHTLRSTAAHARVSSPAVLVCTRAPLQRCQPLCAACKRALLGSHDVPSKLTQQVVPLRRHSLPPRFVPGRRARRVRLGWLLAELFGTVFSYVSPPAEAAAGMDPRASPASALAGGATRGETQEGGHRRLKACRAVCLAVCRIRSSGKFLGGDGGCVPGCVSSSVSGRRWSPLPLRAGRLRCAWEELPAVRFFRGGAGSRSWVRHTCALKAS